MSSELRKIAVFGAGGDNIGHHILKTLLSEPSHFTVSVIARASSKSIFPSSVEVIRLPESPSHADLVAAFRGQDAIVSAVGFPAKLEEPKLIDAAIEAGVKRFLPSEYGLNNSLPAARELNAVFASKAHVMDYLKKKESQGLTWTSVPTGMWLDWCINLVPEFSGIDTVNHTALLWDDGKHRLSFTTLPWAAEAIAQILRNPELTKNKVFPVRAFEASQRDIVTALEEVQAVKYQISHLNGTERIGECKKKWEEGDSAAVVGLIQAGFFLPGFGSNLVEDAIVEVGSDKLDLPKLRLREAVAIAVKAS